MGIRKTKNNPAELEQWEKEEEEMNNWLREKYGPGNSPLERRARLRELQKEQDKEGQLDSE